MDEGFSASAATSQGCSLCQTSMNPLRAVATSGDFPVPLLPPHIFEPRYKEMIAECLEQKKPFGMVRAKENAVAEVGCSAVIVNVMKRYEDGRMDISSEGRQRFTIVELNHDRSFLQAEIS